MLQTATRQAIGTINNNDRGGDTACLFRQPQEFHNNRWRTHNDGSVPVLPLDTQSADDLKYRAVRDSRYCQFLMRSLGGNFNATENHEVSTTSACDLCRDAARNLHYGMHTGAGGRSAI